MSLSVAKKAVRSQLLKQRMQLTAEEMLRMGAAAQSLLVSLDLFAKARTLALYWPIRQEIDTADIHRVAQAAHKCLCYPRVDQQQLRFFQVESSGELIAGRFGILEPGPDCREVAPAALELMLVPGVAFDRRGFRLGYGCGFYDRFLAVSGFGGKKIGFAYDFQLLDCLPAEEHDHKIDLLVTDQAVYSPLCPFDARVQHMLYKEV